MFRKSEVAAAAVVCGAALLASPMEARTSLVPCGLLAGLAGLRSPTLAEALLRGSKAGALGGLAFVAVTGASVGLRTMPVIGAYAVDVWLFTSFAMVVMLVPLYGIEGLVAGPLVRWAGEKADAVDLASAGDVRQ